MPGDDGCGLHHHESLSPPGPEARQQRPQRSVEGSKARSFSPMLEAGKPIPEGKVLGDEVRSIPEDGDDWRDDQREKDRHDDDGRFGFAEVDNG